LHGGNGCFIEQSDTIPEQIALGGLEQERALADGNPWFTADARQAFFVVLDGIVVALL
jgi:hypothetical protein